MKKTYLKPTTIVTALAVHNILAGSPLNLTGDSGQAKVYSTTLDDGDVVLSRRDSFWDDEEE